MHMPIGILKEGMEDPINVHPPYNKGTLLILHRCPSMSHKLQQYDKPTHFHIIHIQMVIYMLMVLIALFLIKIVSFIIARFLFMVLIDLTLRKCLLWRVVTIVKPTIIAICLAKCQVYTEKIPARPMLFYCTNYLHQF